MRVCDGAVQRRHAEIVIDDGYVCPLCAALLELKKAQRTIEDLEVKIQALELEDDQDPKAGAA